jgi:general stress protein 26
MGNKGKVLKYIEGNILTVVATVNSYGKPESSLVAFTQTSALEIIFGTFVGTRKYKNLKSNPFISLVIGHDFEERITVQYEGEAREVIGKEAQECLALHLEKNPRAKKYAKDPNQRWFKIKPVWIRYTDLKSKPPQEFEIKFS